jgi:hypothetical protein
MVEHSWLFQFAGNPAYIYNYGYIYHKRMLLLTVVKKALYFSHDKSISQHCSSLLLVSLLLSDAGLAIPLKNTFSAKQILNLESAVVYME